MSALLLLLVVTVFVMPAVFPFGTTRRLMTDILMSLILVSGVVAVAEHRKSAIALAVLSLAVIVLAWTEWFVSAGKLPAFRELCALGAFLLLAFAVGINVFASGHAIGDRVFGAIVLYLLLGLIWAVAYNAIETHVPGSFTGRAAEASSLADWAYFSFVTLTTVGYGDIAPVSQGARSMAILEALVGQLYPAVIIARLVSLQVSSQ
ncbi:MAG TPA: potassium channel family protein [Casimicrobiaceae bacterium]